MKIQEVILKAMAGKLKLCHAAGNLNLVGLRYCLQTVPTRCSCPPTL